MASEQSTRSREPVVIDLGALTTRDMGRLADELLVLSNAPTISRRGGNALAAVADQVIRRSRTGSAA